MEIVFRVILFLAGIVNTIPILIAFLPKKIASAYGITIPDANYELLLRHRAVSIGIIGGLMIYAALVNKYSTLATTLGLISMLSFIMLYALIDTPINPSINKVMKIDVITCIVLIVGFLFYKYFKN